MWKPPHWIQYYECGPLIDTNVYRNSQIGVGWKQVQYYYSLLRKNKNTIDVKFKRKLFCSIVDSDFIVYRCNEYVGDKNAICHFNC
jgi:hypothetical protein